MAARVVVQTIVWLVVMGVFLFGPAGTLAWPQAWVFLVELAGCSFVISFWLLRHDPGLLAQRMASPVQRGQPLWDQALLLGIFAFVLGWLALMGLDAQRWRLSDVPIWAQALGAVAILATMWISTLTFRANSFAAPVVKIQAERGHHIVTGGPYRVVRHPMYGSVVLFAVGVPLLLGSWLGLAAAPVLILAVAVRAVGEERTLAARFPEYAAYARRVRYRLVPLVW
jgi:protein-S-isoprenylcysteine O-methyltransferase Ste14